jgi:predicted ATPase/DNA-binding NarL/FixJ family response regulator
MELRRTDGNLAIPTTPFIGRTNETADVRRQMASARLVTLTGIGGVGKTRLAAHIANDVRRAFPDGAWLVDLAALEDPALVADTVATTLGIPNQSARWTVAALAGHLSGRRLLLVLDNCEHLLDACAVLADALLNAPDLRILATSRQPLDLSGEQTVVVPPMAVPDPHYDASVETLAGYDAVRLFVTRANAVLPGFRLTERNAAVVTALCGRLDGLPLAIELAAVRLRALSPEQILARLDERFRLLTHGSRVAAPRHQTLHALVGWSYELCSTEEQTLWNRVSVFVGSFDLDAVENVCADESLPRKQVLDHVAGLVDKSVLLREEHDSAVRYRLLDTIRDYGRQRLATEDADDRTLRRRHRDHYRGLAVRADTEWFSAEGPRMRQRLQLELPNLRTALDFCLSDPTEAEAGMELAATLAFGWRVLGLLGEGRRWLDRLLAASTELTPARAHALAVNGSLAILQGDVVAASALLRDSISVAERFTDTRSATVQAYAALFSGLVAMADGNMAVAADLLEGAFAAHKAMATPLWAAFALIWLSMAASALADPERAERCAAEYLALCEEHGAHWLTAFGHFALALEYWRRGAVARAAEEARTTIQMVRDQDSISLAAGTEVLAWVSAAEAQPRRAACLLGAVDRIWRTVGAPMVGVPHLTPTHEECVRRTRTALGEQDFLTATEQGARFDAQALIAYALEESPAVPTRQPSWPLTRREYEVAGLVAAGLSNKKIASTLTIAPRTAESHVDHILTKLGFTSRAQIAAWVTARDKDRHQATDENPN